MENTLCFGTGKDIITPATPQTMMGFASVFGNLFTDVHDDLFVRVLLLSAGGKTMLLIAFDLCFHDESLPDALRAYAAERYGVAGELVHISYTHTHYGPAVQGYDMLCHQAEYEEMLVRRVCVAIDRAFLNRRPGRLAYTAVPGDWNISRRLPENGEIAFKPNLAGGRDENLHVLRMLDLDGKVRGLMVSFACHPSNFQGYRTLSAEYPGRLCALLEAQNYGCGALFLQGFGGDAKLKIGAKGENFSGISAADLDETATGMANRVQKALAENVWREIHPDFAGMRFTVPLPLQVYPKAWFEAELENLGGATPFSMDFIRPDQYSGDLMMRANAEYICKHYDSLPDVLPLSCGVLRFGSGIFAATMGGEPSYDVQRVLQSILREGTLLTFGYTDAIAYIPSDTMLAEGGYEAVGRSVTEYRLKGECAPGVDKMMKKAFGGVLHTLGAAVE